LHRLPFAIQEGNMARNVEEPVTVPYGEAWRRETKTTHPAFAQIRASRVSGRTYLYGSDFDHQHYITLTICRSELHRNLSRDWQFDKEQLIEVSMSEAQWATFLSSMNMGAGAPCTLERFDGQMIPDLPKPKPRADQFRDEMQKSMEKTTGQIDATITRIKEMGLPKGKTETLLSAMESLKQQLASNLPFVASQFEEHMEDTVENAKIEVQGYVQGLAQQAGLEALTGYPTSLAISFKGDDDAAA
jgi:hypothetical protein